MNHYTLGQRIRFYREQEGLTQEELAEYIHVTKGKLAHWENDETLPRPAMVARLIGALRLPDGEAAVLISAVEEAQRKREQEQSSMQKTIAEHNKEVERQKHKSKAINLSFMGIGGFIIGCVFVFLTGAYRDNPWYFTFIIGLLIAGIPFGWSVLTDKSETQYQDVYYDPDNWRYNLAIKLFVLLLKFLAAYLIGVFAFPAVLLYHSYKACKPGSPTRIIMGIIFVIAVLFIGLLVYFIAATAIS